ncbi:MAG: formimidoylglutamase [Marinirhabdus sp.]
MIEFLSPISKETLAHIVALPDGVLGKTIKTHGKQGGLPDLKNVKTALLAVRENRNDPKARPLQFENLRKALYSLYPGNWTTPIADLGTIERGETVQDTYFAVKTVVAALLQKKITPIILGGGQDLVYAQYRAYDALARTVNIVNVDARFDLGDAERPTTNTSYIGKLIVEKPYKLFNYSVLGYQSYLNPPNEIVLMDKLYFDAFRLGEIVADITKVEPITRAADMVVMDAGAIKNGQMGNGGGNSPNGFNSREICAIARYAGISNRVSSFGLYEVKDNGEAQTMLLAQAIWYFVEGLNFRVKDDDFKNENLFTTYKVPVEGTVLIFKKSNKTGRWWVALPFVKNVNTKLKRHTLLPCTHDDYLSACNQEIPERWYKARQKNEI